MSDDHQKPMRYKTILSWFSSNSPSSGRSESGSGSRSNIANSENEPVIPSSIPLENLQNERVEVDADFDINALERDPGKRWPIWKYPSNEHDNVRRTYVVLRPFQPELSEYPTSFDGSQNRKFNQKSFYHIKLALPIFESWFRH